jgi:hypothetical protein
MTNEKPSGQCCDDPARNLGDEIKASLTISEAPIPEDPAKRPLAVTRDL